MSSSDYLIPLLYNPFTIYCTAHEGWDVTGYQGVFCTSNKPSCDRLPGGRTIGKNWWSGGVRSQKWALLGAIPNIYWEKVPHWLWAATRRVEDESLRIKGELLRAQFIICTR